jgi:hypothetical protein
LLVLAVAISIIFFLEEKKKRKESLAMAKAEAVEAELELAAERGDWEWLKYRIEMLYKELDILPFLLTKEVGERVKKRLLEILGKFNEKVQ